MWFSNLIFSTAACGLLRTHLRTQLAGCHSDLGWGWVISNRFLADTLLIISETFFENACHTQDVRLSDFKSINVLGVSLWLQGGDTC